MKTMSKEQFDEFMEQHGGGSPENFETILAGALKNEKISADLLKWYGSKDKVIESVKPVRNMDEKREDYKEIYKQLSRLMHTGDCKKERNLVAKLADSYKVMLNMDNARAFMLDLAKEYQRDEKLAQANDSQYGKGSAEYIA